MISYNKKIVKGQQQFSGKRVLILGFGREGKDTLRFLQAQFPGLALGIADKNPEIKFLAQKVKSQKSKVKTASQNLKLNKVKLHLGRDYLISISQYDVVIKSPGIPAKVIASFTTKKQKITSATEIFLENCPGIIIGVTGTKGKSTTSAMIYHILKQNSNKIQCNEVGPRCIKKRVFLVGNIGKPALSFLWRAKPNDIFVYELSSHQLYGLKKSPHIAVFLNIFPEHLDYYSSFREYASAKANICRWQTKKDYLVYNAEDKQVTNFAKKSKSKKIPIRGKYYQLDKNAAIAVAKIFGITRENAENSLRSFKFLPHRLERVGTFRGITFYNDSLSTIPQTTIEALDALGNKVETLIAGGYDRGVDFNGLAKRLMKSNIITLILFLPSGRRILGAVERIKNQKSKIKNRQRILHFFVENMKEAVKIAFEHTSRGKICLLSPASPSFGIFKDYKDRGNRFKKYVLHFGRNC